jgi:uncharacterized membrane protein
MDKYNAFTFYGFIYSVFNGIAFGWSQFEATDWAVVPTLVYWKIGCSGHLHLYYLLLNLIFYERIGNQQPLLFFYLQPL